MKKLTVGRAALIAAVLTAISFFRGDVRYSGAIPLPPIWMQLARNFAICFAGFWGITYLACGRTGNVKKSRRSREADASRLSYAAESPSDRRPSQTRTGGGGRKLCTSQL